MNLLRAAAALIEGPVGRETVRAAIRAGTVRRSLVPVLFGAAARDLGVQPLLCTPGTGSSCLPWYGCLPLWAQSSNRQNMADRP